MNPILKYKIKIQREYTGMLQRGLVPLISFLTRPGHPELTSFLVTKNFFSSNLSSIESAAILSKVKNKQNAKNTDRTDIL